jgi:phospholipase C
MGTGVVAPPARQPGSLPFPGLPAGTPNQQMPFKHLVVVMMENHSFDNLLGAISLSNPNVRGLDFVDGRPQNWSFGSGQTTQEVFSFPLSTTAQAKNVSQSWKATHEQIALGPMKGFVRSVNSVEPMGYYTPEVLPFAYSLARTFTLANAWFCSVPGPTYPNRRFLLAGTAYGCTVTGPETLVDPPPPHGTIFDRMSDHNVSWTNYFTDLPMTSVIPSIVVKHPRHYAGLDKFFHDCQSGTLPDVSFVDPGVGLLSGVGSALNSLPFPVKEMLQLLGADFSSTDPGQTEEDPQNMYYGEAWAHKVVEAILMSPAWKDTLLIYTYDEHGGYYDHVEPPRALPPDNIAPKLQPGDPPGGYDMYGPRVPAIVVSPYAKQGGVTNLVHDHTSVLATIERKWNLPALTLRDANAADVMDFIDVSQQPRLRPPVIEPPVPAPA